MTVVTDLLTKPGVIAAGEYTYKAEVSSYKGNLSERYARMIGVMCHATTKGVTMEGEILESFRPHSGLGPARGWVLRGPERTMCVVANVFCLIDNHKGSLNKILGFMRQALADQTTRLV